MIYSFGSFKSFRVKDSRACAIWRSYVQNQLTTRCKTSACTSSSACAGPPLSKCGYNRIHHCFVDIVNWQSKYILMQARRCPAGCVIMSIEWCLYRSTVQNWRKKRRFTQSNMNAWPTQVIKVEVGKRHTEGVWHLKSNKLNFVHSSFEKKNSENVYYLRYLN